LEVKVLEKNKERVRFLVSGIGPSFAGELRRIFSTEVPALAIEWIDFHRNDSGLWDEVLANRLGFIPLKYDPKFYNFKDECRCKGKGCSHCQVTLVIKKDGPATVYSSDLKSSDKNVKPVYDKIPIVELLDGQGLELEATAQLGLGKEHIKWQSAVVGYRNLAKITVGKNCNLCKECVDKCVKKILKAKRKLVVTDVNECNLCMQCQDVCSKKVIKVEPDDSTFIFQLETTSGLSPQEIVSMGLGILEDKLKDFSNAVGKLK